MKFKFFSHDFQHITNKLKLNPAWDVLKIMLKKLKIITMKIKYQIDVDWTRWITTFMLESDLNPPVTFWQAVKTTGVSKSISNVYVVFHCVHSTSIWYFTSIIIIFSLFSMICNTFQAGLSLTALCYVLKIMWKTKISLWCKFITWKLLKNI